LDNLEKQLSTDLKTVEEDRTAGRYSAACYLVPVYQNPIGTILSEGMFIPLTLISIYLDKCRRIIFLARKYNLLLFCDDVYNFHYYDEKPRKRLFAYDDISDKDYGNGCVISNCTFSKILAPALVCIFFEYFMS
jgi:DNA-binding transcriptional MocR family regulator